jgi:lipopolysaccharide exporter
VDLKRQAISGVRWTGISRALATLLQFGTIAVLARLLDPSDFGLMGMISVITGFAQAFADAGISKALIYRQDTTDEQFSSLYWLSVIAGVTICLIVLGTRPLIVAFYGEPRISAYIGVVALGLVITSLGQQFWILIQKDLDFRTLSGIEITASGIASLSAIATAILGWGVWSLVLRSIVQASVTSLMCIAWAAQSGRLPSLHFRRADLQGFVGFGLYQMGERAVNYLSANVHSLIIGRFLGAAALGYYSLAYQLIKVPLERFNPIVTQVAFPTFSKLQHDSDTLRRGYLKVISFVATLSFPMLAGIFVVAPQFVDVVYGKAWLPAVAVIRILCIVGALKALGNPIGSLLLSRGRADMGFFWNVSALVTMSIANWLGARWGIEGVAWSTLVVVAFIFFPAGFYLRWLVVRMRALPYLSSLKVPLIASVLMMILLRILSPIWNDVSQLASLLWRVSIGALIYTLAIRLMDKSLYVEIRQAVLNR